MKNLKFRVKSEKHSEALQNMLFGLGYAWAGCVKRVMYEHYKFILAYDDGHIVFYEGSLTDFESHENQEVDTSFLDFFIEDEKQLKITELKKTIEQAQKQIEELE